MKTFFIIAGFVLLVMVGIGSLLPDNKDADYCRDYHHGDVVKKINGISFCYNPINGHRSAVPNDL